jgi:hypothetical protein
MSGELNVTSGYAYSHKFVSFQNTSQTDLGFKADTMLSWTETILPHLRKFSHPQFTNLLDYLASKSFIGVGSKHPLEEILSEGGSAWAVIRWNKTYARLTKRVPDGVREAMNPVLSATDAASMKLQEAWLDAYGTGFGRLQTRRRRGRDCGADHHSNWGARAYSRQCSLYPRIRQSQVATHLPR